MNLPKRRVSSKRALYRARVIKTGHLEESFSDLGTQKNIYEALENVSNLPKKGDFQDRQRWVSNWSPTAGLRVFGWTHIYNIPWLMHWMEELNEDEKLEVKKKD